MVLALGDRTRVRVLESLRDGPASVGGIAATVPVSRPAVSQHLRLLLDAGLVRFTRDGTRHVYSIDPAGLAELRAWLETFADGSPDGRPTFADQAPAAALALPDAPAKDRRSKKKRRKKKRRKDA
jgi:DNA-binding transcriptional ArsR family regulator